nr:ATP-binding cassette domain-containing protein [Desulfobulbaceae bacterium]
MTMFREKPRSLIQVRDLTCGFENQIILKSINFDVNAGEIFIILGGSGCGKSTLLKHMIGLLQPLSGTIVINEMDVTGGSSKTLHTVLRQCGILFQSGALFGSMTLAENVALPLREYSGLPEENIQCLVKMKLNMVGLLGYENHFPTEISGGMKKRAGLARAMALNPSILFCDEPSAGLDPITSAELDRLLLHINHTLGTTMIIVTHELSSVFNIADRVIMLDKNIKGIVAEGDPFQLRDHSLNSYVQRFFRRKPEAP